MGGERYVIDSSRQPISPEEPSQGLVGALPLAVSRMTQQGQDGSQVVSAVEEPLDRRVVVTLASGKRYIISTHDGRLQVVFQAQGEPVTSMDFTEWSEMEFVQRSTLVHMSAKFWHEYLLTDECAKQFDGEAATIQELSDACPPNASGTFIDFAGDSLSAAPEPSTVRREPTSLDDDETQSPAGGGLYGFDELERLPPPCDAEKQYLTDLDKAMTLSKNLASHQTPGVIEVVDEDDDGVNATSASASGSRARSRSPRKG